MLTNLFDIFLRAIDLANGHNDEALIGGFRITTNKLGSDSKR